MTPNRFRKFIANILYNGGCVHVDTDKYGDRVIKCDDKIIFTFDHCMDGDEPAPPFIVIVNKTHLEI